jgi:hypothetical protein|tara:strand:- start:158 stop:601 length:444 start_codon:yes stop_codon:yes gene_type:complete
MAKTPNKDDDSIADALDLDPIQDFLPAVEPVKAVVEFNTEANKNLENDYKYARENLYNVIERGTDALNGIVDLAQQSQHPRSFEVVADLVRTLASANKDLLAIQKQVRELQPEEKGPSKVTNNLFVGSTKDITDLLAGTARQINKKK